MENDKLKKEANEQKGCFIAFMIAIVAIGCYFLFFNNSDSSASESEYSATSSNDEVDLRKASIIAKDFVKSHFAHPSECDFEDLDYRGEECIEPNRFKVLQQFTAKNSFGVESEYVYKIYIQYFGGEWEDVKNWGYGELIIENRVTKKQEFFYGDMKSRERVTSGTINIAGIDFNIAEQTSQFIKIYTSNQLDKKQLKKVLLVLKSQYNNIQICADNKIERGDEYVCLMGDNVYDYRIDNFRSTKLDVYGND